MLISSGRESIAEAVSFVPAFYCTQRNQQYHDKRTQNISGDKTADLQ